MFLCFRLCDSLSIPVLFTWVVLLARLSTFIRCRYPEPLDSLYRSIVMNPTREDVRRAAIGSFLGFWSVLLLLRSNGVHGDIAQ